LDLVRVASEGASTAHFRKVAPFLAPVMAGAQCEAPTVRSYGPFNTPCRPILPYKD